MSLGGEMFSKTNNKELDKIIKDTESKIIKLPQWEIFTIGEFLPDDLKLELKNYVAKLIYDRIKPFTDGISGGKYFYDEWPLEKNVRYLCDDILERLDDKKYKSLCGVRCYDEDFYANLNIISETLGSGVKNRMTDVKNKDITSMRIEDVSMYLAHITKNRILYKFHISHYIKNGILQKLITRIKIIINEGIEASHLQKYQI